LRNRLQEAGFEVFGEPSAIVPVKLGSSSLARFITKYTLEAGALVNLVEYPAVAKDSSRWRLQVMSDHTTEQIDELIEILVEAKRKAEQELNRIEFLV
ncbi:MAG: hypothetical protein K0R49_1418, partial [Burkholderiales bacterium]|nr:hypothetical protein [Burkholderiales bacterium]